MSSGVRNGGKVPSIAGYLRPKDADRIRAVNRPGVSGDFLV